MSLKFDFTQKRGREAWDAFAEMYPDRVSILRLAFDAYESMRDVDQYLSQFSWLHINLDELFKSPDTEMPDWPKVAGECLGVDPSNDEATDRVHTAFHQAANGDAEFEDAIGDCINELAQWGIVPPAEYEYKPYHWGED